MAYEVVQAERHTRDVWCGGDGENGQTTLDTKGMPTLHLGASLQPESTDLC